MSLIEELIKNENEYPYPECGNPKEDGTICFSLHCKPSIESLLPDERDSLRINYLQENGYELTNRIDCRERTIDRHETIIYWYEKKVILSEKDIEFLNEYYSEAAKYFKYDVLRKYGITKY